MGRRLVGALVQVRHYFVTTCLPLLGCHPSLFLPLAHSHKPTSHFLMHGRSLHVDHLVHVLQEVTSQQLLRLQYDISSTFITGSLRLISHTPSSPLSSSSDSRVFSHLFIKLSRDPSHRFPHRSDCDQPLSRPGF